MSRPVKLFESNSLDADKPKYLQLAHLVRHAIQQGQYEPGDALPSVKSMSNDLSINRHTVMKALAELVAEGWIESIQRVGYKVVSHLPIESSVLLAAKDDQLMHADIPEFTYRFVRQGGDLPEYPAAEFEYNFAGGQPDMSLFPFAEFKSHMSDTLSRPALNQMGYGEVAGTKDLLQQVGQYLRKTRAITGRELVITNGSQEAMYIIAQLLLKKGDKVAVENLGYPPAMSAFKSAGANLVGIEQDSQGILPDDLEKKIAQGKIRLIYLTPLHQYPTTVTLSISRRMRIYQLASEHQIPIVEDDYDHEFHYRCQPLAPMASQDPQQLVIYISTLSKIMFPGARIGIMAISPALAKAVESYRLLICHKSNVLMQAAVARWMRDGGFERHLRRISRHYQQRRDHAVDYLAQQGVFEFAVPDGGMAIWLKLQNTRLGAAELVTNARQHGMFIQHEGEYHLESSRNQDCHIRLGFAGMNEHKFSQGVDKIVSLMATK